MNCHVENENFFLLRVFMNATKLLIYSQFYENVNVEFLSNSFIQFNLPM